MEDKVEKEVEKEGAERESTFPQRRPDGVESQHYAFERRRQEAVDRVIKGIKEDKFITKITHIFASKKCAIGKDAFYRYIPNNSEDHIRIYELLNINKTKTKKKLMKNWVKEDAAAPLQLAAFKILADGEELARLGSNITIKNEEKPLERRDWA